MFRRVTRFLKDYKEFSLTAIALIIGGGLDLAGYETATAWVLGVAAAIAIIPLASDMLKTLRSGNFGIDVLAVTAIVVSIILKEYYAAIIVVLMLTGGESLEDYAEKRARNELSSLLKKRPKIAHLIRGRKITDVKASSVQPGDKLQVLPGEVIPVDGTIIEGTTSIDESTITGESVPITRGKGDDLLSGSINIDGVITIKAAHTARDSQYEQIIKLVRNATNGHSPFVRLADRYSVPFTALAFFIAGAAWFISKDVQRFLEVLVVATPCPLLLGAPIAIISGMSRASRHGVIIKNGSSLERLAEVNTVAFDKTGTLTMGIPTVDTIETFNSFSKDDIVGAAAAIEQNSNHILAKAITEYALTHKVKFKAVKQVKESAGHGLSGRANGKDLLVGHRNWMLENKVEMPEKLAEAKQTVTYVAIGGKLAGVISFTDTVRDNAPTMMKRLRKAGVKTFALITGDNKPSADAVAGKLHISNVYADCLPVQKMHAIESLKGPVAFVGDGVNDAPVLTTSDVGIALGARGSTAASETADVVIMHDDVSKVATSVEVAKRTMFIAKQSVLIGIFISIGLMAIFATGRFTPVQGALVQELVDIIVIINALRAYGSFKELRNA